MKTDEELLKIIKDNETFLRYHSHAQLLSVDKAADEVRVAINVTMASPRVSEEGKILYPRAQEAHYALIMKLRLSDLFQIALGNAAPERDITQVFKALEERDAELKDAREEAFDLYHQACCVECLGAKQATYDNQCMSTYECVEDKLIEWGMLKPEQCLRRINKKE